MSPASIGGILSAGAPPKKGPGHKSNSSLDTGPFKRQSYLLIFCKPPDLADIGSPRHFGARTTIPSPGKVNVLTLGEQNYILRRDSTRNYLLGDLLRESHKIETIKTLIIYISAHQAIIISFM